ncbi:MAG: hypothetical protein EON90_13035 [Brevundimonas sp.]|nr:MAG: hypothetical protein EON90_13035 [Brevundimonas sp.]
MPGHGLRQHGRQLGKRPRDVLARMSRFLNPARAWIAAAGLIAAMTGAPALAQVDAPPPPVFSTSDRNGVDMVQGTISIVLGSVSIGPEAGGLSNTITMTDGKLAGASVNHTIVGGISEIHAGADPVIRRFTVTFMGETTVFTKGRSSSNYVYREGRGGKLTFSGGIYTYTAHDGSVGTYSTALRSWNDMGLADQASLVSVVRPNGETLTYHYVGTTDFDLRLQSVTNNYGYQIHFQHMPGSVEVAKVEAINNAVDPCAPTTNVCTLTQTWPTLTQTSPGVWTNALGQARRSSPAGVVWPDPAYPAYTTQYIWESSETAVTSVSDGVGTWTYAYGEPPLPNSPADTSVNQIGSPNGTSSVTLRWAYNETYVTPKFEPSFRAITDPLGNTTAYGFRGNLITFVSRPEGGGPTDPNFYDSEAWSYDPTGKLISWFARAKQGSGLADKTFTLTYGDCSTPIRCQRPTSVTDVRGNVSDFTYDAAGNLLTSTAPAPTLGAIRPQVRNTYAQQYAWYKQGGSSSITQAATPIWVQTETSACATSASCNGAAEEVQTTTTYQAGSGSVASNLLPVSATSGSGDGVLAATTTSTWDSRGDPLTVDGPLAGTADTTRYVHDAVRQQVGVIGPDPDDGGARLSPATRTTFNAQGQPTAVAQGTTTGQTDPAWAAFSALQTNTTSYDARGFKSVDTSAAGSANPSVVQYAYDAEGRLICAAQRMNPAAFGSLPGSACTLGPTGSFGPDRITHTTYDAADRPIEIRIGYATPEIRLERVTGYTVNGQADWIEDGLGNRSDYTYDGFDRLARLTFPSATVGAHAANASDYEQYGFDAANNPTMKRIRSGDTFTTTFDALNRITLVDAPSGTGDTSFTYDLLGRRLTATRVGGQTVTSVWDALGRNTAEAGALGAMTNLYDLAGRRTRRIWANGNYVDYGWDLSNHMTSAAVNGWLTGGAFAYDNLGRRTVVTRYNGVTTSYGYNTASQLTSLNHDLAGTASDLSYTFSYTPAPQVAGRTVSNSVYDYTPTSGATVYANNGLNQSTSAGGASVTWDTRGNLMSDSVRSYTYDAANRLLTGGGSTLTYDALDRLYQMTGTGAGRFQYDGSQLAAVFDSGGTMTEHWVGGSGPDEWLTFHDGAQWYWPLQNAQGSVVALADQAGAATSTLAYDEYGQPRAGNTGRMQYTGQMWLPDMGLYYYKARGYHAGLGRFVQTDPVGYEQGLNLYAYVGGDPINTTDPTGMLAYPGLPGSQGCTAGCETSGRSYEFLGESGSTSYIGIRDSSGTFVGIRPYASGRADEAPIAPWELVGVGASGSKFLARLIGRVVAGSLRRQAAEAGVHAVYVAADELGSITYVGMTNSVARRTGEQLRTRGIRIRPIAGLTGLTAREARGAEQALIELYGLGGNGGQLLNRINSIARTNPAYAETLARGVGVLARARYPGF